MRESPHLYLYKKTPKRVTKFLIRSCEIRCTKKSLEDSTISTAPSDLLWDVLQIAAWHNKLALCFVESFV